jgi:hypothetical protein
MAKEVMVAVVVEGGQNLTRITSLRPLNDETLDAFAKYVSRKRSGRNYYIYEFSERGMQRKKGAALYRWHMGEGFLRPHYEGWWVETELEA